MKRAARLPTDVTARFSRAQRRRSSWRVLLPLAVCIAGAALTWTSGCSSPPKRDSNAPLPTLASSTAAQEEFRRLSNSWHASGAAQRNQLEPQLRRFMRTYPKDDQIRLVRTYLAWILIQKGELVEARRQMRETKQGPRGTARDFSRVVEAALMTEHGRPEQALKILRRLQGKIIDPVERFLTTEQLVIAAQQAALYSEALSYMVDWIEQSRPRDREAIRESVRSRLRHIPARYLERATETLEPTQSDPDRLKDPQRFAHKQWLFEAITERLAAIAVQDNDARLAAHVVEKNPNLTTRSDTADLLKLAAGGETPATIAGRTIGLIITTTDPIARQRAAEVASGVSSVLGYEGQTSGAVQLVLQEDSGDAEAALAELSANGAALLVAGIDEGSAERSAHFAARSGAPVLLLAGNAPMTPYAFSMGVSAQAEQAALIATLNKLGVNSMTRLDTSNCDAESRVTSAFPAARWKDEDIEALVLLTGPRCARDVRAVTRSAAYHPWFALGLDAAAAASELAGERLVVAQAGRYPFVDSSRPEVKAFVEEFGRPPRWFEALGHDVAQIALDVLSSLPEVRLQDASEVETYYASVRRALNAYESRHLWTTSAARFENQQLTRTLQTMQIGPNAASP